MAFERSYLSRSYQVLEREVRANLVYRDFTRVGAGKAPDAKTMGRWGVALGPGAVEKIHARVVESGDHPREPGGEGAQDARGHDGGGDQYSQSDRQQPVE